MTDTPAASQDPASPRGKILRVQRGRVTGSLLIGDAGEHSQEEVDVALTHRHSGGWCAITGGYVRRGRYIYGDLCSGRLWSARLDGTALTDDRPLGMTIPNLVSFGQDSRGRVYAVSFLGTVYRVA